MTRRVYFLVYPDFQLLDAAGPIAAFETAERHRPGSYSLRVVAAQPGLVASSSGVCLPAVPFGRANRIDTLDTYSGQLPGNATLCAGVRPLDSTRRDGVLRYLRAGSSRHPRRQERHHALEP